MRWITRAAGCILTIVLAACSPPPTSSPEQKATAARKPRPVSLEELGFRERGPGIDMWIHRLGAGELDESGWCHAASTNGGFSVSLPNVFNDFTMTARAEDGVAIKTFAVGTRDERLVKFTALGISRPDGKFKGDPLDSFAEQFVTQSELKEKRLITLGELKGVELKVANRVSSAVFRLYQAPTTLYQLIVESPSSIPLEEIDGDVKRFMDSFSPPTTSKD
jgi:hypothetical protein